MDELWQYKECPLFRDHTYIESREIVKSEENNPKSFVTILDKWFKGWHTVFEHLTPCEQIVSSDPFYILDSKSS